MFVKKPPNHQFVFELIFTRQKTYVFINLPIMYQIILHSRFIIITLSVYFSILCRIEHDYTKSEIWIYILKIYFLKDAWYILSKLQNFLIFMWTFPFNIYLILIYLIHFCIDQSVLQSLDKIIFSHFFKRFTMFRECCNWFLTYGPLQISRNLF